MPRYSLARNGRLPWGKKTDEFYLTMAKEMRTAGMPGHRGGTIRLMQENDFEAREVEFTDLLIDAPGKYSQARTHGSSVVRPTWRRLLDN